MGQLNPVRCGGGVVTGQGSIRICIRRTGMSFDLPFGCVGSFAILSSAEAAADVQLPLRAGLHCVSDRLGRGSALRLAVRRNPAWTAGFSGFLSFDVVLALASGPRSMW